jgi:DNA-binding transcriptional ArsR family regulator
MRTTTSPTSKINRKKAEAASEFMKRLANPNRLMIACALVEGERSVGELEILLKIRQPALSQQLAELREAGIVVARREVKQVFYRLSDRRAAALIAMLHRIFCGEALDQAVSGAAPSMPSEGYAATPARSRSLAPPPAAAARQRSPEAARFARVITTDPATT